MKTVGDAVVCGVEKVTAVIESKMMCRSNGKLLVPRMSVNFIQNSNTCNACLIAKFISEPSGTILYKLLN